MVFKFLPIFFQAVTAVVAYGQAPAFPALIPQPAKVETLPGHFTLTPAVRIAVSAGQPDWELAARYFQQQAMAATGFKPAIAAPARLPQKQEPSTIYLRLDETIASSEGYRLEVTPQHVELRARTAAGAFYGLQTLRQLFPPEFNSSRSLAGAAWTAPACRVEDAPRFAYRGLHLDVGRHFFPVDFIKRYIDLLALHKYNTFHWHLTEDQGWRIEIKQYPRLQTVAACRAETLVGHNDDQPRRYDGKKYCGFYTQDEIRDVVEYARQRFVTVVPEIEMPGHSLAALAAYPELGCTGGPYAPATSWGVFPEVFCAGNEQTFVFLENVLDEVCALFPGQYVHVGGDECPKDRWEACPKCQSRIKEQGLKDEHELQSYFIRRAEAMLAKRGKKLIGWDEILEGGLAPTATVMSWRGTEGGIAAARAGHDAIMTPGSHVYLDYYQAEPDREPLANGGFTPLEKVYAFEPVPAELTPAEARHILGAQGNVWTEYLPDARAVEYMVYPRAVALAEVLWTAPENKSWSDFARRLPRHLERLDRLGVGYAKTFFDVRPEMENGLVRLTSADTSLEVRFTLDDTEPTAQSTRYTAPFRLLQTARIRAAAFRGREKAGNTALLDFRAHKAQGRPYSLQTAPRQYTGGGPYALTDGRPGAARSWDRWVGLAGADFDVVIDLGRSLPVERVTTRYVQSAAAWIYPPRQVEVHVSEDGKDFTLFGRNKLRPDQRPAGREVTVTTQTPQAQGRYVRLIAQNYGPIPPGAPGAGEGAWLFLDEVVVE